MGNTKMKISIIILRIGIFISIVGLIGGFIFNDLVITLWALISFIVDFILLKIMKRRDKCMVNYEIPEDLTEMLGNSVGSSIEMLGDALKDVFVSFKQFNEALKKFETLSSRRVRPYDKEIQETKYSRRIEEFHNKYCNK